MIGVASNAIVRRGRLPFVGSRNEAVLPAVPSLPQQEAGARPPKWQVSESNTSVIRASTARSEHGESVGSSKAHQNFAICAPISQRSNVEFRICRIRPRSTSLSALKHHFGNRQV